jgi:hypothetical protein
MAKGMLCLGMISRFPCHVQYRLESTGYRSSILVNRTCAINVANVVTDICFLETTNYMYEGSPNIVSTMARSQDEFSEILHVEVVTRDGSGGVYFY